MVKKSPLDDPENALFAWARFRRIMRLMMGLTIGVVLIAFAIIYTSGIDVSVHFYIAVALGLGLSMLLTSALMGLVFFLAITPLGAVRRLFGKDALNREFSDAKSYRVPSKKAPAENLKRPY